MPNFLEKWWLVNIIWYFLWWLCVFTNKFNLVIEINHKRTTITKLGSKWSSSLHKQVWKLPSLIVWISWIKYQGWYIPNLDWSILISIGYVNMWFDAILINMERTTYDVSTTSRPHPKGQLISKYLFGVFDSPKNRTKTIRLEVP